MALACSQYEHLFRIRLAGDMFVGKTSLQTRLVDNSWSPQHRSTLGVDFRVCDMQIDNQAVRLEIWDNAGGEHFQPLAPQYYKKVHAILLVYDVTKEEGFCEMLWWEEELRKIANPDALIVLVGNKSDLTNKRKVSTLQGQLYAQSRGLLFFETSAKESLQVREAFECTAKELLDRCAHHPERSNPQISMTASTRTHDMCC